MARELRFKAVALIISWGFVDDWEGDLGEVGSMSECV